MSKGKVKAKIVMKNGSTITFVDYGDSEVKYEAHEVESFDWIAERQDTCQTKGKQNETK